MFGEFRGVLARKADAFGYPFRLTHFSLPISRPLRRAWPAGSGRPAHRPARSASQDKRRHCGMFGNYTLLYSTLLYSTLFHSTLLYSTLLYSTLLYSSLLHSTLLLTTIVWVFTAAREMRTIGYLRLRFALIVALVGTSAGAKAGVSTANIYVYTSIT